MPVKPCINITIEKDLLKKIDQDRREISLEEQRDLSRSAYMCALIRKGLEAEKRLVL